MPNIIKIEEMFCTYGRADIQDPLFSGYMRGDAPISWKNYNTK